jgi:hypothetical protein
VFVLAPQLLPEISVDPIERDKVVYRALYYQMPLDTVIYRVLGNQHADALE